jgi:hypothetical protein
VGLRAGLDSVAKRKDSLIYVCSGSILSRPARSIVAVPIDRQLSYLWVTMTLPETGESRNEQQLSFRSCNLQLIPQFYKL